MPTQQQAVDTIFGAFSTAWSVNPTYPVVWPGKTPATEPMQQNNPWCFAKVTHGNGKVISLAGNDGTKIWKQNGSFSCEIYIPSGRGTQDAYTLARLVQQAFIGKEIDGVRFRGIAIKESGIHGNWFLIYVIVDFEYDEIV